MTITSSDELEKIIVEVTQSVGEKETQAPTKASKPKQMVYKAANRVDPFTQKQEQQTDQEQTDSHSQFRVIPPGITKKKIGRNDPCWCGSGKKFKKCHYPNYS